jgi:5-hydroxyisourate hydrolase-like protein (transthyretin family)
VDKKKLAKALMFAALGFATPVIAAAIIRSILSNALPGVNVQRGGGNVSVGVTQTQTPQTRNITIAALDAGSGTPVSGAEIAVMDSFERRINPVQIAQNGAVDVLNLENGEYTVTVSAGGYVTETLNFNQYAPDRIEIRLQRSAPPDGAVPLPLLLSGWPWGEGLTISLPEYNTIVLNGSVTGAAGYAVTGLDSGLGGGKIFLEINGTRNARLSEGRLLKLEADSVVVRPDNIPLLIEGEYIPAIEGTVEFTLPRDFGGKINFVFYQAELNNLRISAFYERER